jgi:hypothetical protein
MLVHALTHQGHRVLVTTAVTAIAAVGLVVATPAAQAATSALPAAPTAGHIALRETFNIPAGQGTYAATAHGVTFTVVRAGKVSPAVACTLNVENPTISGSEVQGVAWVSCTSEIYKLEIEAALFYNGTEESYTIGTLSNTSGFAEETQSPLQAGDWQTGGEAYAYSSATSYTQLGPALSSIVDL